MFKILSVEDQLRMERARGLEVQNKQKEVDEILLQQLVDLDYRQSLSELGVNS